MNEINKMKSEVEEINKDNSTYMTLERKYETLIKDVRKYEVFRQKMLAAASGANDKIGGEDKDAKEEPGQGVDLDVIANMGGEGGGAPAAAPAEEEEDLYG